MWKQQQIRLRGSLYLLLDDVRRTYSLGTDMRGEAVSRMASKYFPRGISADSIRRSLLQRCHTRGQTMRGQRVSDILRHASLRTHRAHGFIAHPKTNQSNTSNAAFVASPLRGKCDLQWASRAQRAGNLKIRSQHNHCAALPRLATVRSLLIVWLEQKAVAASTSKRLSVLCCCPTIHSSA